MGIKSIKKNYIYNLSYQILTIITPLITAPYLSRVFGPDGVGTYSYIEAISSYFVLFATLGLTTFGQREISYVQQDRQQRTIVFWETLIIEVVSSLCCTVAYVIFSMMHSNWLLYLVLSFNLFSVMINVTWFFQGMEEFGKVVFKNIIFKIVNIVFVFGFVREKDDLIIYLLGTAFLQFLINVSLWVGIKQYIDIPKVKDLHPTRHLRTVISLFVPTIAIQIYTVLDKTMIGLITNNAFENGYYEQALKMSKMVLMLVTSLGTVMIPRIGYYFGNGEHEIVKKYMYRAYRFVWFLGVPLCIGLMLVADNFVPWFFGEGYDKVSSLIRVLSLLIIAIGINNVTGMQYLIPSKRQNLFTKTVVYGAITNFVLNFFLIRAFQSYGAAIASVTAETVIAIVQIYLVRKELSPIIILKSGTNYFIAGVVMAVLLYMLKGHFLPSVFNTLLLIILGAITYFIVLLTFKDQFFYENTIEILKKIIKK